ncbi:MAG TPA: hypothetical protein VNE58_10330 [Casimicrobiaceae bacterium]|nr:hypothetical protein [Casimicrobiaceae bacterium]
MKRRTFLVSIAGTALGGCATIVPGGRPGPPIPAPLFRIGDRWVYRVEDGYRAPVVWQEAHEVSEVAADRVSIRVVAKGPTVDVERVELLHVPGIVRQGAVFGLESKPFEPALVRYRFPLVGGATWTQRVRDPQQPPSPYGPIDRYTTVGGFEDVTTPAGTFSAVRMRVLMRLDDETFWRHPTECNYLVWYAPDVGASVRELRDADYLEKGSGPRDSFARVPVQHARIELVSFTRGR